MQIVVLIKKSSHKSDMNAIDKKLPNSCLTIIAYRSKDLGHFL